MRCRIAGRVRIRRDEFIFLDVIVTTETSIVVQLAPGWRVGAIPSERRAHAARAPPAPDAHGDVFAGERPARVPSRPARVPSRARYQSRGLVPSRVAIVWRACGSRPHARARRFPTLGRRTFVVRVALDGGGGVLAIPPPFGTPPRPVVSRFTARAPPRTAHSSCSPPRTPATTTATPRPSRRHPPRCSPRPPTTHP